MNLSPDLILLFVALFLVVLAVLMMILGAEEQKQSWHRQSQRYRHISSDTARSIEQNDRDFFATLGLAYPVSEKESVRLAQLVEQAGVRAKRSVERVRGAKLLLGVGSMLALAAWQWFKGESFDFATLAMVLVAYVLGSNLPEYWLKKRAGQKKAAQQEVVPDAIDLMVISIEAGLSLERSLQKVGEYLHDVEPTLSAQFLRTHSEIQVMGDAAECLKKLAWRTGSEELERLANTLALAQRYGSPLAETMRSISSDARQMRKMNLQEQAGKLPGRITLIQMAFIMLPLMVLIIAPTMNLLLDSLR